MDGALLKIFAEATLSIFAIVNPVGLLPVFVSLTEELEVSERRRLLRLAGLVALVIMALMGVAGQFLLSTVFHIRLAEFMFAGGLLITVVGVHWIIVGMRRREKRAADQGLAKLDASGQVALAVSPIAMPLLVGPGSIMTVILTTQQDGMVLGLAATVTAFLGVLLILNFAHTILGFIGRIGSLAISRIMQIFIIAVGVKYMVRALEQLAPILAAAAEGR